MLITVLQEKEKKRRKIRCGKSVPAAEKAAKDTEIVRRAENIITNPSVIPFQIVKKAKNLPRKKGQIFCRDSDEELAVVF